MSIYKNGKLIAGGRQCMPLLSFMWADHVLNDASWLRADTFSWQSGSVYQAVYQHLTADITGKTLQSETISGITIQFYLADDGHKVCPASEESNVTAIYNATGVAWYYIIDTTNQRFKLPRTKYGFTGLRDTVGNYIEESVPNIKTDINLGDGRPLQLQSASGAIYNRGNGSIWSAGSYWQSTGPRPAFDASLVSSAYKDGAPVQPKATEMYLYFYVGQFTQTALENTAGLNTELFNEKADLNLTNVLVNIDFVVERQEPTAENNYTWYRKYRSGWVEQGQKKITIAHNSYGLFNLPIAMSGSGNYIAQAGCCQVNSGGMFGSTSTVAANSYSTTQVRVGQYNSSSANMDVWWEVKGQSAN